VIRIIGSARVINKRLARVETGDEVVENTESIATVRVSNIIAEFTNLRILRANVRIIRRSHSSDLSIIPESITIRSSSMVVAELVIRMSNPERSGGLISVNERPRAFGLHNQVTVNKTLSFSSIFNKDGVTHGVISKVV